MSVIQWEHFFKPEVRNSGRSFVTQGKVTQSRLSDTEIQTYIRASTSLKVIFKCESVTSSTATAECSCPLFKKGQFCKHIWAALLVIEEKFPDFLESKTDLQSKPSTSSDEPVSKATQAQNQDRQAAQAVYKERQTEYRKAQYQRQKQQIKDRKQPKKSSFSAPQFPSEVEQALDYFFGNGFSFRESMNSEDIATAKKKLSRIFHPDVGGSHEEILELNKFTEILIQFSKN